MTFSKEKHINLVLAGNMPDIGINTYGSYANLGGLLDTLRANKTPTIFAFAGGSLGPSPLSSLDRGSHIIDLLNTLEPDLMTLTKREFSYFEDELTLRAYEAAFPIVSGNLFDSLTNANLEGISTKLIVEKNNAKIGFISILDEEVVEEYLLQRAMVVEPREIIQQQIAELKQQNAELVVLVYSKERDYYQSLIASGEIDFALRVLPIVENTDAPSQPKGVYAIANKETILQLSIRWQSDNPNKNLLINRQYFDLQQHKLNPATSELIAEYNLRLNRLLDQQIGVLGTDIQTSRNLVRTREMPFGNFIADALKHYAQADIGFINGGVIRGDKSYPKGTVITRRDIATELPFRAHISQLSLTGEQIKQALEHSVSEVASAKGRFLQVSGISFTYLLPNPVGSRVSQIRVNDQAIVSQQTYSIATSDYLANGGDGYDVFRDSLHSQYTNQKPPLLSDIVIRAIQQQQNLAPKVEFRIKQVVE
jgi:2',3'-cyclic-nucleotide 2'-phosphodiesterase (5'-nucleotidase family)